MLSEGRTISKAGVRMTLALTMNRCAEHCSARTSRNGTSRAMLGAPPVVREFNARFFVRGTLTPACSPKEGL